MYQSEVTIDSLTHLLTYSLPYLLFAGVDGNEELIPLYGDEDPFFQPPPADVTVIGKIESMRKCKNDKWKIKINDAYVKLVNKDYIRKDVSIKLDTGYYALTHSLIHIYFSY